MKKYRLIKDLPNLSKGVIFEHRDYDSKYPDRGSHGSGCLILGWLDGDCQDGWCGETYIFPGQLAGNKKWFEPLVDKNEKLKLQILYEIEILKQKLSKLCS